MAQPELGLALLSSSGQTVARFGGVAVPVAVSEVPESATGRFHVTTGGVGRLQVDGYVDARALPLFLTQDVDALPQVSERGSAAGDAASAVGSRRGGSIVVPKGSRVEFAGGARRQDHRDLVHVVFKTQSPLAEVYSLTVPCSGLGLAPTPREPSAIAGHARGYFLKGPQAPLFDSPGTHAAVLATLRVAPDAAGVLFFGDRREGDFIHVLYRKDVRIDGYMSVKDLELLPKGELVDQRSQKPTSSEIAKLTVGHDAKLYRTTRSLSLYGKADPKQPPIGLVPADTELYVLDVVVGWANVLPKQLDVVPLNDKRFWVRAGELGI